MQIWELEICRNTTSGAQPIKISYLTQPKKTRWDYTPAPASGPTARLRNGPPPSRLHCWLEDSSVLQHLLRVAWDLPDDWRWGSLSPQPSQVTRVLLVSCYGIVSVRLKCCAFKQQISSHSISLFFFQFFLPYRESNRGLPTSNKVRLVDRFLCCIDMHLILIEKLSITVKLTDNLFCYTCCRACCHLLILSVAILLLLFLVSDLAPTKWAPPSPPSCSRGSDPLPWPGFATT